MPGFPLFAVQPELLAKIINKFDETSYFRAQQTAREVNEFIRSCRSISVRVDGRYVLRTKKDQPSYRLYCLDRKIDIDLECFYGTRVKQLRPVEATEEFEPLYCSLKENRVTCTKLAMEAGMCQNRSWPGEDLKKLLSVLKPADVELNSETCNRFEVLLDSPRLKNVEVHLASDEQAARATQFLSTFPSVTIHATRSTNHFSVVRSFLQILRTEQLPNLRVFRLRVEATRQLSSKEEQDMLLRDFNLNVRLQNQTGKVWASMDMPHRTHIESACKLVGEDFRSFSVYEIFYCAGPAESYPPYFCHM